ncbi:L-threonylcarbamoyladenylate synthase [Pseudooceanicola onchidii]|uniref:L-threonylcarbamoyladenylate synthase n=1 Tax=Pseudooceanicola onchidii TaxID=2562279 RepID=UPI0010AAEB1C|nr:L-threonylcarbamoyladenylate synthase [Pseudooceanicola onchidii]
MTEVLPSTEEGIARAAGLLRDGALVAMPTETVYGLAGLARDDRAVAGIYEAKGRPSFNPLIVHVAEAAQLEDLVEVPAVARPVIDAFWPGPLTIVLPLKPGAPVSPLVTAGLRTLAVRMPAHPVARALLRGVGAGVAAPSANPSGRISPTTAAHVMAGLDGRIAAVLDGGDCAVGVESTILGFPEGRAVILREGGVTAEALAQVLGYTPRHRAEGDAIDAPGQLASHYAPQGRVRLGVTRPEPHEVYLGFGDMACDLNLSASGDLAEAAANLFRHFHAMDARGAERIAVAPVPEEGLGAAINDRLRRAAAPR